MDVFDVGDIRIVGIGGDGNVNTTCELGDCPIVVRAVTQSADSKKEGVRAVTFALRDLEPDANQDPMTDVLASGSVTTSGSYVDVVYTGKVGANPRNALVANKTGLQLPEITAADGSRVAITSENNDATVDVEKKAPKFSNPVPAAGDATGSDEETISIDVTDDDLAGVDKDTVMIHARVASAGGKGDLDTDATFKTASGNELTFEDIDGGFRVSVALDEIADGGLRVNAARTPTIRWYVTATDNAKNSGTSDAVADDDADIKTKGTQVYTFSVDGEATEIDRVYTGDWFDIVEERVEGDRRLGPDQYLPGSSANTSLRVVFKEAIDGGSVTADDFTVDGAAPTAALWYSTGDTNPNEDPDRSPISASVFLTVPAMSADATPEIAIVGSISDKAGNATTSGTKVATDGIAPSPTLSVDSALSQGEVTVTVESDERIRTLTPDLALFVSNALDREPDATLDETDTFIVSCEKATEDPEMVTGLTDLTCELVLRQYGDGENTAGDGGEIVASGNRLEVDNDGFKVTLSKGPISDADESGDDALDVEVENQKNHPPTGTPTNISKISLEGNSSDTPNAYDADAGVVTVVVGENLEWGDRFVLSYRGVDPDSAIGLASIASGRQVTSTSWIFALDIDRSDKYAVTASAEDANFNRGSGGIADPTHNNATVFEIDDEIAGDGNARTLPSHDVAGNTPVSIQDPFYVDLYWDGSKADGFEAANEGGEYPGDSSRTVTLTKAVLDGSTDVIDQAVRQTSGHWRLGIAGISLGEHTLKYNAEDALGNTYDTDRTLTFTVQPVPDWELRLTAGMNLVSVPSNPTPSSVNEIFGATEAVKLIFTFEGGQSRVALRNPDKPAEFVGTLDTIDAMHAYWVSTDNAATIKVSIPPTSQLVPPPFISVKGGQWNLLPVISLGSVDDDTPDRGAAPGTKVDPDSYFGKFRTAFGWSGRSWVEISPDPVGTDGSQTHLNDDSTGTEEGDNPLHVGKGYWVLYEDDAIITP
jgi:hypothetical protein